MDTSWPIEPIHASLLPTKQVLFWGKGAGAPAGIRLWDPTPSATPAFTSVPEPPTVPPETTNNIFCSGHAFTPGGKLLVTGGHDGNGDGIITTNRFDPVSKTWATGLPNMNGGRWYPTTTALATGEALVISGEKMRPVYNNIPQVWQPSSNSWRDLSNAMLGLPYYPYMFVAPGGAAPGGRVFCAGPTPITRYLNTGGIGSWEIVATHVYNNKRNWGSAVMYKPGKVLVMGGTKCDWYDQSCKQH